MVSHPFGVQVRVVPGPSWTPKDYRIVGFLALFQGFGPSFCTSLGSRKVSTMVEAVLSRAELLPGRAPRRAGVARGAARDREEARTAGAGAGAAWRMVPKLGETSRSAPFLFISPWLPEDVQSWRVCRGLNKCQDSGAVLVVHLYVVYSAIYLK